MKRSTRRAALASALLCLAAAACASSETRVLAIASQARGKIESVSVVAGAHAVGVDLAQAQLFERTLRARLYGDGAFAQGGDMIVEYNFVRFERGTAVKGYVVGLDETGLSIIVRFLNPGGVELSKIKVGGRVRLGAFDDAARKAADEAADYAITQYR